MFLILVIFVEVENGAVLHDVIRSWKMILGGHENWKVIEKCGNPDLMFYFW